MGGEFCWYRLASKLRERLVDILFGKLDRLERVKLLARLQELLELVGLFKGLPITPTGFPDQVLFLEDALGDLLDHLSACEGAFLLSPWGDKPDRDFGFLLLELTGPVGGDTCDHRTFFVLRLIELCRLETCAALWSVMAFLLKWIGCSIATI